MLYIIAILTALVAYLIGSINTSIILSKKLTGEDIRNSGSGNAGATNMLRTHGKGMAIATLLCDIFKGVLVVVVAIWIDYLVTSLAKTTTITQIERILILGNLKYIAGVFVVLGHDFPVYFGFKGGKGVATSLGVITTLNWQVGLIVLAIALTIMITSRYVSLASICAAVVYPFILLTYMIAKGERLANCITYLAMSAILALTLVIKPKSNIIKLKSGTENKLFAKKNSK